MQIFNQTTLKYLSSQFYQYFERQHPISPADAKKLIEYEIGVSAPPSDIKGLDYSSPKVQCSGTGRPTAEQVYAIRKKIMDAENNPWNVVFDELIKLHENNQNLTSFMIMRWKSRESEQVICSVLHIERDGFYRIQRGLLGQAAVISLEVGLTNYKSMLLT